MDNQYRTTSNHQSETNLSMCFLKAMKNDLELQLLTAIAINNLLIETLEAEGDERFRVAILVSEMMEGVINRPKAVCPNHAHND